MNFNTILAMIAASTPDGRWQMLQAWLRKNPKMRKRIDKLSAQSVEEIMGELEVWAIEKYGIGALALVNGDVREKIRAAIENLQTRYIARAAEDKPVKEIKNVDGKRSRAKRINRAASN